MRKTSTLALCLFSLLGMASMASAQNWTRYYNGVGGGNDSARSVAVDVGSNVIVTGGSYAGAISNNIVTVKYDPMGTLLWTRSYDGPAHGSDIGRGVAVDNVGNIFVTGQSQGSGTGLDFVTLKYAPNGTLLWSRRYSRAGNNSDIPWATVVDRTDGSVYVAGGSYSTTADFDFLLIKYDANGNRLWVKVYDGAAHGYDFVSGLILDNARNVIITGGSTGVGTDVDFATLKFAPDGTRLWVKRYNSIYNFVDFANAIAVDGSGNVFVTGNSYRSGTECHFVTIKYDPDGTRLWVADFSNRGIDIPWAIATDLAGNVFVAGQSATSTTGSDYLLIKYDTNRRELWKRRFNGAGSDTDVATALAVDSFGNAYVTGFSYSGSEEGNDIVTLRYNNSGDLLWQQTFAGTGHHDDLGNALTTDPIGNCYMAGAVSVPGAGALTDYILQKFVP